MSDNEELWDPADAVTVAYVNHNEVAYSWHHSMVELIGYDIANKGRILQGGYIAYRYGTDGLVDARNKAVEQFLQERDAQWLFWIDTDMGFTADTIDRLMEAADPLLRPIVGGLCFTQRETNSDGLGGWRTAAAPTIFDWFKDGAQQGFGIRWDYPTDAVVQCSGTGSACILIHRSVFERIFEKYGRSWYDKAFNASMKQETSEDLSFCMRALALGIPVHVHTGVKTSHQKTVWLSENEYRAQRPPLPATEETAVIVPVLKRPQNAAPFMQSLRASTGLATVYAIAEPGDTETIAAWRTAGAQVLLGDAEWVGDADQPVAKTFAEKVNLGYRQTREPWLFLVGDDVRFHPGWLDHAQDVGGNRYHVVGTNDLVNPRVTSGEHATHVLVRRSYVDEVGASWDGPKIVAHEGYHHWYVDDEIVTAAKHRAVWSMAINSHVEHRHPGWGKAPNDEVYELGQSFAAQDKEVFRTRCAINV